MKIETRGSCSSIERCRLFFAEASILGQPSIPPVQFSARLPGLRIFTSRSSCNHARLARDVRSFAGMLHVSDNNLSKICRSPRTRVSKSYCSCHMTSDVYFDLTPTEASVSTSSVASFVSYST